MNSGWGMRWHDDGRTEMRVPDEPGFAAAAVVGFELADLHLLREALLVALQRPRPPTIGVGGVDRPMTEHDELDRLLQSVEHSINEPPVATY